MILQEDHSFGILYVLAQNLLHWKLKGEVTVKGSFSKAKDVIEEELHTNTSGTTLTFGSVLRCNTKFGSVLSAEVPLVNGTVFLNL